MCGFQKKKQKQVHCRKPGASFVYPKRRFANLLNLSRFHKYISYSLFTNEIAKLFDSEFENEDHGINMPFLKDACVSI